MTIPSAENPVLAQAVERPVPACGPERIYLFGSAARGDAGPDSDYDFMVIVPDEAVPNRRDCGNAYLALRGLGIPGDVLVWTRATFDEQLRQKACLPSAVLGEGKLLYAAS
jgi:predicted nucleotidyltransferase